MSMSNDTSERTRGELDGKKVAFVTSNEGVEQVELTAPWEAVQEAGGSPVLIRLSAGTVQCFNHLDKADQFPVDQTTAQANPREFDAFVVPGGVANADELRMDEPAVAFVHSFFDDGKPVAVICHGPWALVEADVVRGRTLTRGRACGRTFATPVADGWTTRS